MATKSVTDVPAILAAGCDCAEKKRRQGASNFKDILIQRLEKASRRANQTAPRLDGQKKQIRVLVLPSSEIPLLSYALKRFAKDGKIAGPKIKSGESIENYLKANPLSPEETRLLNDDLIKKLNDEEFVEAYKKFTSEFKREELEDFPLRKYRAIHWPESPALKVSSPSEFNDIYEFGGLYFDSSGQETPISREAKPRVLCLSAKKRSDPYMWCYYGGGYKGCCLLTTYEKVLKAYFDALEKGNIILSGAGVTKYESVSKLLSPGGLYAGDDLSLFLGASFLKPKHLKQEKEYRFVTFGGAPSFIFPKYDGIELGLRNMVNAGDAFGEAIHLERSSKNGALIKKKGV